MNNLINTNLNIFHIKSEDLKEYSTNISLKTSEIAKDDKESRLSQRQTIESLEKSMEKEFGQQAFENVDIINQKGLKEYFVGGAYTRQLFIPANMCMVTKLWKKERLWIIPFGRVSIVSELGVEEIEGPYVGEAPFGSKATIYTHEDTLWLAVTGAESTTSEDVEQEVLAKDYSEIEYPWDKIEYKEEIN